MTAAEIKFQRILSIRSKDPGVLASVDGYHVKWHARRGWDCACLTDADEFECEHIGTIRSMLDDRVTTPIPLRQPRYI